MDDNSLLVHHYERSLSRSAIFFDHSYNNIDPYMQLYKRCSYVVVELEVRYSNIKPLGVFQHVLLTVIMFILQNLAIG